MKKLVVFLFLMAIVILITYHTAPVLSMNPVDSTNHGWEVRRNANHAVPEIPGIARDAIIKYNGIYVGDPGKKIIYLTIDLGYESGNTAAVLDMLKTNDVKATFFITSSYLDKNKNMAGRIIEEGHSLQNHTANYKHLNTLSEYSVRREIMDLHDEIEKEYGISMKYLRLPYEDWSERVLKIASSLGYKTVFWSNACVDWVEGKDASYIYNSIMNNYHNGAIIMVHAVSKSSPAAINMIVKELKRKGYEFRCLDL
jgi:Predicted xylanase/chitin deacetylase